MRDTLLCCFLLLSTLVTGATELFADRAFQQGFEISALHSHAKPLILGRLFATEEAQPRWRLDQWGSRFSLKPQPRSENATENRAANNPGKAIELSRYGLAPAPEGAENQGLMLAVKAGAEYQNHLRKAGEAWPHLLVEQAFEAPPRLSRLDGLAFHLEFKLEYCRATVDAGLDPRLHTAQVTAYWAITNANPDSPDYRDMIWFGLPLYDVRYPIPPAYAAVDGGKEDATGKFIYVVDGNALFEAPLQPGAWRSLDCDMLRHIEAGLKAAQAQGFLSQTSFADLLPANFNLGWEVTGPYDCAIRLRHLSMQACAKD